jgi:hypothetical protein
LNLHTDSMERTKTMLRPVSRATSRNTKSAPRWPLPRSNL